MTETIKISGDAPYGYYCSVCGNSVPIRYISEVREICPECARRLKKLLYPEEKDD